MNWNYSNQKRLVKILVLSGRSGGAEYRNRVNHPVTQKYNHKGKKKYIDNYVPISP